jgi:hypothetical protein
MDLNEHLRLLPGAVGVKQALAASQDFVPDLSPALRLCSEADEPGNHVSAPFTGIPSRPTSLERER